MPIRIYVDQGHSPGGVNGGAVGMGLVEQDVTFYVGLYLSNFLNDDYRFEARTSRQTIDEVIGTSSSSSLKQRVDEANSWPANYFVSIHCNSSTNPNMNGTEVYVYAKRTQAAYLAEHVLDNIVEIVGTRYNGVRANPNLYVLRKTKMPAILVELAYITNYKDSLALQNKQYAFAYAIYRGLLDYFGFEVL